MNYVIYRMVYNNVDLHVILYQLSTIPKRKLGMGPHVSLATISKKRTVCAIYV